MNLKYDLAIPFAVFVIVSIATIAIIIITEQPIEPVSAVHTGIISDHMTNMIRQKLTGLSSDNKVCTSDKPFILYISANNTTGQDRNIIINDGSNEVKYDLMSKTGLTITIGASPNTNFNITSSNDSVEMFVTIQTMPIATAGCT